MQDYHSGGHGLEAPTTVNLSGEGGEHQGSRLRRVQGLIWRMVVHGYVGDWRGAEEVRRALCPRAQVYEKLPVVIPPATQL